MKLKVVLFFVLSAMLSTPLFFVHPARAQQAPQRIEVTASRFQFTPSEITVKKGQPVVIVLKSADVAHGLRFKDLGLNTKVDKGQTSELPFTPEKTGDFVGQCSVFCGSGHGHMKLVLHVVE
jgi:cytochrome c oxidase subunit 2